jgi:Abnormal spindle-like microcephaly-assoc'd, ASPM-SPD-2-Hydin
LKRLFTLTLMCVLATVWVSQPAVAAEKLARVAPKTINFGSVPVGTEVLQSATITNISGSDVLLLVESALPDDFGFGLLPGSTCPALTPGTVLAAGASCDVVVRFTPTEFFAGSRQTGELTVTLRDPATGEPLFTISIPVVGRGR